MVAYIRGRFWLSVLLVLWHVRVRVWLTGTSSDRCYVCHLANLMGVCGKDVCRVPRARGYVGGCILSRFRPAEESVGEKIWTSSF
jgi:hypothetical protein